MPFTIGGILLAVLRILTPIMGVVVVAITSGSIEGKKNKKIWRILSVPFIFLLGLGLIFGVVMLWFPGILEDLDFYLNHGLGIYHPYIYFS